MKQSDEREEPRTPTLRSRRIFRHHAPDRTAADRTAPSAPDSQQAVGLAAALGCFVLALVLMAGACCLMLDWSTTLDLRATSLAVCTLAAALAFVGFGVLCLLQKREDKTRQETLAFLRDPVEYQLDRLDLTDKERSVARLILSHHSYNDIARLCHIAPRTVQFHATNVFRKAAVARRRDFENLILNPPASELAAAGITAAGVAGPASAAVGASEGGGRFAAPSAPSPAGTPSPGAGNTASAGAIASAPPPRRVPRLERAGASPTATRSRMVQQQGRSSATDLNLTK